MDIQALMERMSTQWMRERAETQMTLGELTATLAAMPPDAQVVNLCNAHSYRGYYSDLAFERCDGTRAAAGLLVDCRDAIGEVFEGYKGGDFTMGKCTPVWVADYGCCGEKLMSIAADGGIETAADAG